jgi:pimeloyl-ACP methyl ester carboxylesterase
LRRTSIQKRHRRGLSSCYILFFLSFVARQGFVVDEYRDEAIGFLKKDEHGPLVMSKLILRPKSIYTGNSPDGEAEEALRHRAHLGTPEVNPLMMKTQPNYSARDMAEIGAPVTIVQSEHDEFIKREHAEYLAQSIPNAELVVLNGVSHFAPLQRPEQFNDALLAFLRRICP